MLFGKYKQFRISCQRKVIYSKTIVWIRNVSERSTMLIMKTCHHLTWLYFSNHLSAFHKRSDAYLNQHTQSAQNLPKATVHRLNMRWQLPSQTLHQSKLYMGCILNYCVKLVRTLLIMSLIHIWIRKSNDDTETDTIGYRWSTMCAVILKQNKLCIGCVIKDGARLFERINQSSNILNSYRRSLGN